MSNQFKNKYTEKDYKDKCKELNLSYVGYHKGPAKKGTMIDFICNKHKEKGIQSKDWSHFKNYKIGCTYCSGRGKTNEDIEKEIKDENVILLSKYLGNEKPILCKCKVCGNEWNTLPKVLITNRSGCPVCGKKKSIQAETKTKDQFVNEMQIVNKDIEIVGDYVNTHTKIKCFCKICHTTWYGYPANLLNRSTGCPGCNMSIGEKTLLDALDELGIVYTSQYCIHDGKHRKPLRIDAFNKENNIAFEFNGEQHYYPVDFAGKGTEWAENQFNLTIERDKAKEQYCIDNGMHLIIVPYWEKRNIKNFLINKIKELNLKIA